MNNSIPDQMFEIGVRFEQLIWIPGIIAEPPSDGAFEDFCESLPDKATDPIYEAFPFLLQYLKDGDYPTTDEVGEQFAMDGTVGFLIQLAKPVVTPMGKDGKAIQYSWGNYHTRWVYVASMDGFVAAAQRYSDEMEASDRAKAARRVA